MKKGKLAFTSHTANLALMRNFVRRFLARHPFSEKQRTLMVLGIDEACTKVLSTCVRMRLRDYGAQKPANKMRGRNYDEVRPGGLGLHLIRNAFDKVDYILKPRGTELVLTKNLD